MSGAWAPAVTRETREVWTEPLMSCTACRALVSVGYHVAQLKPPDSEQSNLTLCARCGLALAEGLIYAMSPKARAASEAVQGVLSKGRIDAVVGTTQDVLLAVLEPWRYSGEAPLAALQRLLGEVNRHRDAMLGDA